MALQLKPNTYLTLDEVKDWLKILPTETKYDQTLVRLINTVTTRVEAYIDGPVLTRDLTEFRDGTSSNVIVPSQRPIVSLVELRIDYNRGFGDPTIVDLSRVILRGTPSLNQKTSDTHIKIQGQDVVLFDDNNTALLGRIFAGSVIQSIKLKYRAGWGDTPADLPDDLVHASLMAVEFLYMLRENRDLGIGSRGNFGGQSYHREIKPNESGFPLEIEKMLDDYKDWSLGITDVAQKNTFTL